MRSPLATSVQMDEDFVGQTSRLSRRVENRQSMLRTSRRYLVSVNRALSRKDCGHTMFVGIFQDLRGLCFGFFQAACAIRKFAFSVVVKRSEFLARFDFSVLFERLVCISRRYLQTSPKPQQTPNQISLYLIP